MRKLLGLAAAAGFALAAFAGSAQAMPSAPLSVETQAIEKVADGCGRGWHLNRYGECVPNRVVRRYYRPYYYRPYWGWGWGGGWGYRHHRYWW